MRRIFFLAFLAIFLLQGTVLACFVSPSFKTMVRAVPMACCAKICQKNTSTEEAQTACNAMALRANHDGLVETAKMSSLAPAVAVLLISYKLSPPCVLAYPLKTNDAMQHRRSLPLYLASHALLI